MGEIRRESVYATTTTTIVGKMDEQSVKLLHRFQLTAQQALVACVLAAALGSFCSGMFVGWSSHAFGPLSAKHTETNVARIASYLALGAACSPLLAQRLWPRIGTKAASIASGLVMCTSIIGLFIDIGLTGLLVVRFASGLAIGVVQLLMPVYIQDVVKCATDDRPTPTSAASVPTATNGGVDGDSGKTTPWTAERPAASSMTAFASDIFHLQFVLGVLTMFIAGLFDQRLPHLQCIVMVACTVAFTIAACLLPESPRFLCQRPSSDDISGPAAARQMIRQLMADGGQPDVPLGPGAERLLLRWSTASPHAQRKCRAWWSDIWSFGQADEVLGSMTIGVLVQSMGVIAALFYMERLLQLTFDAPYSPSLNAVLCTGLFALFAGVPLVIRVPRVSCMVVPASLVGSVLLSLYGLHFHYRGTVGLYEQLRAQRSPDDANMLAVLLFGFVFGLYALGAMRFEFADGLGAALRAKRSMETEDDRDDEAADRMRPLVLAVGWLCTFAIVRVLPALINYIGLGWLLWYMMANWAMAGVFLHWWLERNVSTDEQDERPTDADDDDAERKRIVGENMV